MSVTFEVYRGSTEGKIIPDKTTRTLEPNEVFIEITHAGLCGSDEVFLTTGQALGHEGVGIVQKIGRDVQDVKIGDRVGFGVTHSVCGNCRWCSTGLDQHCEKKKWYGWHDLDIGAFGDGFVMDAGSVIPIPDGYDSADAAPLMCAGATVWTVLTEYDVRPTDRVGIMGVGGLGHLGIKLAAAMGCHVVVLSRAEAKRDEAYKFGASEYHVFAPGQELEDFEPLDHLLLCGNHEVDMPSVIPLMNVHGSIYLLTVQFTPLTIPSIPLVQNGIRVQGSLVASRQGLRNLVKFAAEKKITPTTMKFPLTPDGVEAAMQTLREGRMRYRAVLVRGPRLARNGF